MSGVDSNGWPLPYGKRYLGICPSNFLAYQVRRVYQDELDRFNGGKYRWNNFIRKETIDNPPRDISNIRKILNKMITEYIMEDGDKRNEKK